MGRPYGISSLILLNPIVQKSEVEMTKNRRFFINHGVIVFMSFLLSSCIQPFSLRKCLRRISGTVTIKCAKMKACGMGFHVIDVWVANDLVAGDKSKLEGCWCGIDSENYRPTDPYGNKLDPHIGVIASTILHEMVHVCCRTGESTPQGCEKSCFSFPCGDQNRCGGWGL